MHYICNCKKDNFFDKSYTYWENREVTSDELEIINFLDNNKDIVDRSILHLGIGNSYFAKKFSKKIKLLALQYLKKKLKKQNP